MMNRLKIKALETAISDIATWHSCNVDGKSLLPVHVVTNEYECPSNDIGENMNDC